MKKVEDMTLREINEHRRLNAEIEKAICCDDRVSATLEVVNNDSPYRVEQAYFIRTVTFYYVGRLVKEYQGELVLADCAWIAYTGRFSAALESGNFDEVEAIKDEVIIPKSGIIDAIKWMHHLPLKTK